MPGLSICAAHSLTYAFLDPWLLFGVGWFLITVGLVFLSLCVDKSIQCRAESWAGLLGERQHPIPALPLQFSICWWPLSKRFRIPGPAGLIQFYFSWRQWLAGSNVELGLDPALVPWDWALIRIVSVGQFTHNVQGSCVPIRVCTTPFTFIWKLCVLNYETEALTVREELFLEANTDRGSLVPKQI